MWTVGNGEVEESGVECTLEKQVGVDADAETRGFGGLRLFVLMTSYGMIRCATLASSVSISSKKKKKKEGPIFQKLTRRDFGNSSVSRLAASSFATLLLLSSSK
jgi:hypothetical protein